jgi:large subunit ribosomal protein L25
MAKIELSANLRAAAGKGAARKIRNGGNTPAIIYGDKQDPVAIELDGHNFGELVKKPGLRTKLFVIDAGGSKENAMLMDIQYHPVKDTPMHADFKRIDVARPVSVAVPLVLLNAEASRGLKMGGALNFAVRNVVISAKVDDIPEKIEVDIRDMNITDTVHGRDLVLPSGVELGLRQADLAFITITGKMKEEVDAKKDAAPAADAKKADSAKPEEKKK